MVGWHHQLNGHELDQTLGDSEGQGSPVCCSPWGCKESDMTERLNNNISSSNEYSGLISFRMDWLDLLAVQGTLKSLLQHYSSKASILWVLSFLYDPTLTSIHDHWKTIALTRWTTVGKVVSLLFNMLSRLVITFLPRSKRLLISWLQSPSAVIFPIYFPGSDRTRCHDLRFLNVEL